MPWHRPGTSPVIRRSPTSPHFLCCQRTLSFPTDVHTRYDKTVGLVETMLKLHKDLPKAKMPQVRASG